MGGIRWEVQEWHGMSGGMLGDRLETDRPAVVRGAGQLVILFVEYFLFSFKIQVLFVFTGIKAQI